MSPVNFRKTRHGGRSGTSPIARLKDHPQLYKSLQFAPGGACTTIRYIATTNKKKVTYLFNGSFDIVRHTDRKLSAPNGRICNKTAQKSSQGWDFFIICAMCENFFLILRRQGKLYAGDVRQSLLYTGDVWQILHADDLWPSRLHTGDICENLHAGDIRSFTCS